MKKIGFTVALLLLISPLFAQQLPGEQSLHPADFDIKGDIEQLDVHRFQLFGLFDMDITWNYQFEKGRLKHLKNSAFFGEDYEYYTYHYDKKGQLIHIEAKRLDSLGQLTGPLSDRKYQYRADSISYQQEDHLLKRSHKEVLRYDQHGRLVAFQIYNGQGQIREDYAYTYQLGTKEKKLHNTIHASYALGKLEKTVMKLYRYEEVEIEGQTLTKIQISRSTSRGKKQSTGQEERYYNKEGLEIKGLEDFQGLPKPYIYQYTFDDRGNWIIAAKYYTDSRKLETYAERRLVYTDGHITGNTDFDTQSISARKLPFKDYQFTRFLKEDGKSTFTLKDLNGKSIHNAIYKIGFIGKAHFYVFEPKENILLEMTNFQHLTDEQPHAAKVLSKGIDRFLIRNKENRFYVMYDGKIIKDKDFHYHTIRGDLGYLYIIPAQEAYRINWPEERADGMLPMNALPKSEYGVYWLKFENVDGLSDFLVYDQGTQLDAQDTTHLKAVHIDGADYVIKTADKCFRVTDFNKAENDRFYVANAMTEAGYQQFLAKRAVEKTKAQKASVDQAERTFFCGEDLACALRLAQHQFQSTVEEGKSEAAAYNSMAEVFAQAYDHQKNMSFEMMMKIEGKYTMGLQKALREDVRKYIRQRSQQAVNQYTQKHGKPKIKTVPYQPKN
ncbi:MAG: hypothetical protein AAFP19_15115 [Bacteroidota bacterium]